MGWIQETGWYEFVITWIVDSRGDFRFLIETSSPALMKVLAGMSAFVFAAATYVAVMRWLWSVAPLVPSLSEGLEFCVKAGPLVGILGTVQGMSASFRYFRDVDQIDRVLSGLHTAFYSTGYGIVVALSGMVGLLLAGRSEES